MTAFDEGAAVEEGAFLSATMEIQLALLPEESEVQANAATIEQGGVRRLHVDI